MQDELRGETHPGRILVLAGTAEARNLANALVAQGRDVTSSFAGVTQEPLLPVAISIVALRRQRGVSVPSCWSSTSLSSSMQTHPFAAQMSAQAHAACEAVGIPLVRVERPQWQAQTGDSGLRP